MKRESIKRDNKKEFFHTPSIYLTTALILSGYNPIDTIPVGGKECFRFPASDDLNKKVGEFYAGMLRVDPEAFTRTLLDLKVMIYKRKSFRNGEDE